MQTDSDAARQAAVDAYKAGLADPTKNSPSLRDLEAQTGIPRSTIHNRMKSGAQDHKTAAAHLQAMTPAEETSLVDYIRRMSLIGHPPSHEEIHDVANYLRQSRLSTKPIDPTSSLSPAVDQLGKHWIAKFRRRHPDIVSTWTRALDTARIDGEAPEKLVAWFTELRGLYDRHHYEACDIFNMDETGFAIGATQSTRVLTILENGRRPSSKATKADTRGEWTTSIECVSADGTALPPLVILKGKGAFNESWLPAVHREMSAGWTWAASNTGWSNDYLGLKWLREVFIPSTTRLTARPTGQRPRRLLIVDGHGSHVRSTFISVCIENDIDLMILPAHTSHRTQPLDMSVFRALKGAMTRETNRVATYQKGTIHKAIYTSLLIAARSQAMTPEVIKSGFRNTGIWPLRPSLVIGDIEPPATPTTTLSQGVQGARTPLASLMTENRDFIRDHGNSLRTPAKKHLTSLSHRLEAALSKIALLEREIAAKEELERANKRPRKGMTVANVGQHHFSTPAVLQQAIQLETEGAGRRGRHAASQPSNTLQDGPERSPTPTPVPMRL